MGVDPKITKAPWCNMLSQLAQLIDDADQHHRKKKLPLRWIFRRHLITCLLHHQKHQIPADAVQGHARNAQYLGAILGRWAVVLPPWKAGKTVDQLALMLSTVMRRALPSLTLLSSPFPSSL